MVQRRALIVVNVLAVPRLLCKRTMLIMMTMPMMIVLLMLMKMKMIYICWWIISGETGIVKDVGALAEDYV